MNLNGSNLEFGLRGDVVRSLHVDLLLLGFMLPDGEGVGSFFGDGTCAAAVVFKDRHGFGGEGVVDQATARSITAVADPVRPRVMRGWLDWSDGGSGALRGVRSRWTRTSAGSGGM